MKTTKRNWRGGLVAAFAVFAMASIGGAGEEKLEELTEPHAYLGVYVEGVPSIVSKQLGLDPDVGVVVEGLVSDGPAEKAGIEKHDILLKFDDQILIGTKQIVVLVRNSEIGSKHKISYMRGGKEAVLEVELGEGKPKKKRKMEEHGHVPVPLPPIAPRVSNFTSKVNLEALRALEDLEDLDHDVLFFSGDDEVDIDRRMEFNEKMEVLIERVNSAVEGVEGIAMPTVVFEDENQVFEFADDSGARYVIVGNGEGKELTIVDASGEEVYCGPLDEEAKQKLPERIRDRLPRIQTIVTKAPRVMTRSTHREEMESF